MSQSRTSSSEGVKPTPAKSRRWKKDPTKMFKDGLNWDKYLQICNLPAAPSECFKQTLNEALVNEFQIGQKLEAQDPRNPTSICLATVVSLQGPRLLLRLDGGDKCNDFWRLIDSGDIYPLGTHEAKGILLQPPLGYTRNVYTWASFLARNRIKGEKAPEECFHEEPCSPDKNYFEIGMKLEAVDKKNADLICPATAGDVKGDQIFVSFDGWRGAMDYWCHYTSRDLFPVGWCEDNDHPLSSPGAKGDNPSVVARLKRIADESKRQTRSGTSNQAENEKSTVGKILLETQQAKIASQISPSNTRGRPKGRITRSITPVFKKIEDGVLTSSHDDEQAAGDEALKDTSTTADSSGEDDTFDSSASSSNHSCDSYTSDGEEQDGSDSTQATGKEKRPAVKITESQSDVDETKAEAKNLSEDDIEMERTDADAEGLQKNSRRKKMKGKKKKNRLKKRDEVHERRRYASAGDENYNLVRMKKWKKKRRKHSTSSLYDSSPKKRMLGFGNSTSLSNSPNLQGRHMQSPSFLDNVKSPTSLFGFSRDEIVKKATEGWPSRLLGGPGMVVTSDNKLARFGSTTVTNSSCQTIEANESARVKRWSSDAEHGQVTTTTRIGDNAMTETVRNSVKQDVDPPDSSTNTTDEIRITSVSSQAVSSTTHPATPGPENMNSPASSPPPAQPMIQSKREVQQVARRRSRNPQRWSVVDVMNYVREHEPALASHVQLFQIHEIDGQALLLLNSTIAVKFMNMKLGPALKLANLVDRLKQMVPPV